MYKKRQITKAKIPKATNCTNNIVTIIVLSLKILSNFAL